MRIPIQIKKFRGIGIKLLKIDGSLFYGYGISLLTIEWMWSTGRITCSANTSLFYVNYYKDTSMEGIELRLSAGLLWLRGKIWSRVVKEKKVLCNNCDRLCEPKEDLKDERGRYYCSEDCMN